MKLTRWGLRLAACQVCGSGDRLHAHHPTYEGRRASWLIVVLCADCHRRVHSNHLVCPPPVDLAAAREQPSPYLAAA